LSSYKKTKESWSEIDNFVVTSLTLLYKSRHLIGTYDLAVASAPWGFGVKRPLLHIIVQWQ
jgi:hypothetical protein